MKYNNNLDFRSAIGLILFAYSALSWGAIPYKINGIDKPLETNVRAHLSEITPLDWQMRSHLPQQIRRQCQAALQAMGHYEAVINIQFYDDNPSVEINIRAGKAIQWQAANIQINAAQAERKLLSDKLQALAPEAGQRLLHSDYEKLKQQSQQILDDYGFFNGRILNSQLQINRDNYSAQILLQIDAGARYRFGEVRFSETQINASLLRKAVPFAAGEFYNKSRVDQLYRNILAMGYYQFLTIENQFLDTQPQIVNLWLQLSERAANKISTGVGFGTDTGARLKVSWDKPLLNSRGHALASKFKISEVSSDALFSYTVPRGKPGEDYYSLDLSWSELKFEENQYEARAIGVSRRKKLKNSWVRNLYINARSEQGRQQSDSEKVFVLDDSFFVTPGVNFLWRRVNHPLYASRGRFHQIDALFSDPEFGSDTGFFRLEWVSKVLLDWQNHGVLGRLKLAYLNSDEFLKVPLSARFYSGGDQTIRGYDYNSLSPELDDGTQVGGNRLAVASVEYLWQFRQRWKAALFYDQGTIGLDSDYDSYAGLGFGVRWLSPLGNVQLDIAHPHKGKSNSLRLHLFMGPSL